MVAEGCAGEQEPEEWCWQSGARLASVLEPVCGWLGGAELAAAGAAWAAAVRASGAWRRLLAEHSPAGPAARARSLPALADLYQGGCPWRALYASAAARWAPAGRLAPRPAPAPLAAAALSPAGDLLALAADDCSFTIWELTAGAWVQAGAGTAAAPGLRGVRRLQWAPAGAADGPGPGPADGPGPGPADGPGPGPADGPGPGPADGPGPGPADGSGPGPADGPGPGPADGPGPGPADGPGPGPADGPGPGPADGPRRLLLVAGAPLSASRAALFVLEPQSGWSSWAVRARAGGAGGCWVRGDGFLALELARLTAPPHHPHYATDVWLYSAEQEVESEFSGVATRALRVYNEAPAVVTQVECAVCPLDAGAARAWAAAEAAARAEDCEGCDPGARATVDRPVQEMPPGEDYYRATSQHYENDSGIVEGEESRAWVRLVVLACGGVLGAWPLPLPAPPPLRARTCLAARVAARRARRQQEAAAATAGPLDPGPEPSAAALRAACAPPAARVRLPARVLGLKVHPTGRCVWAALASGAVCCGLPALTPLRAVATPSPSPRHHPVQPDAWGPYFASAGGLDEERAWVWGAAGGPGAAGGAGGAVLATLLPPPAERLQVMLLTEQALYIWESRAPAPPPPPAAR